ncbi:MAG: alpha/beta hydrolase [Chloroflexi bacterium]|nr:alpha/beta hydrolase [Chloroflexota bacterium]
MLLRLGDSAGLVNLLHRSGLPKTFSDEEIIQYRNAWRQPGTHRAMLNWYRAAFRRAGRSTPYNTIHLPTQIIWGEQDMALSLAMAEESLAYCKDAQFYRLPNATHWVQHDEAERVNDLLLAHLQEPA